MMLRDLLKSLRLVFLCRRGYKYPFFYASSLLFPSRYRASSGTKKTRCNGRWRLASVLV